MKNHFDESGKSESMSAYHQALRSTHKHLNNLSTILANYSSASALEKFSQYLDDAVLDAVSKNVLRFIFSNTSSESSEEIFSLISKTKSQLNTCANQLEQIAKAKLNQHTIFIHPLDAASAPFVHSAKKIRYIHAQPFVLHTMPINKLEAHKPISASKALQNVNMLIFSPYAISQKGINVCQGARLLVDLAIAKNIPVYALGMSWHVGVEGKSAFAEFVASEELNGIISEHGIYSHKQFLARVQKKFPQLFTPSP